MFLFHMQPKHTNSRRQEQTRSKAQLSINAAFKNCVMMSCCPSKNPPRALTHTLTHCFTSCAKVNHTYALKFHLGLERLRRVKSQTKHGCTPTAEHKGHETPDGGTDNELSSVYSKPSKSRTLHMTHDNHNGTDQNWYVVFPLWGSFLTLPGSVSGCCRWFPPPPSSQTCIPGLIMTHKEWGGAVQYL